MGLGSGVPIPSVGWHVSCIIFHRARSAPCFWLWHTAAWDVCKAWRRMCILVQSYQKQVSHDTGRFAREKRLPGAREMFGSEAPPAGRGVAAPLPLVDGPVRPDHDAEAVARVALPSGSALPSGNFSDTANTASSHKFDSQHIKLRASNPLAIAYANLNMPFECSKSPRGWGHVSTLNFWKLTVCPLCKRDRCNGVCVRNCLSNFNKRISSKSSSWEMSARRGFPTVSSPLPKPGVRIVIYYVLAADACHDVNA